MAKQSFKLTMDTGQSITIKAKDWHHAFALCMQAIHRADMREQSGGPKAWDGKSLTLEKVSG
jgi:hypothetical protein